VVVGDDVFPLVPRLQQHLALLRDTSAARAPGPRSGAHGCAASRGSATTCLAQHVSAWVAVHKVSSL